MEMRTVIGITVLVAVLVVSYTIFTDGYGPVEEAVFELIQIPDRDPTPSQIQGAERIREVFNTYGDLQSALQDADDHEFKGDERACWTTHKPLKHLYVGEKGSLTIRFVSYQDGSRLQLLRGNASDDSSKVLQESSFDLKPCLVRDDGMSQVSNALEGCNMLTCWFSSPSKSPLAPEVASKIEPENPPGFLWTAPTRLGTLDENAVDPDGILPFYGPNRDTWSYTLPEGQDNYYIFRYDDSACFMPSGDPWFWASDSKLNKGAYEQLEQRLQEGNRECSA